MTMLASLPAAMVAGSIWRHRRRDSHAADGMAVSAKFESEAVPRFGRGWPCSTGSWPGVSSSGAG